MQVLNRLKMELSNQEYFSDEQYIQFLAENDLTPTDDYVKANMQKQLLYTVIDVLEAVTNDIDLMTGISTEFSDIGQAYEFLEARIQQVKDKILAIPEPEEDYSCFSLMYTREPVTRRPYVSDTKIISNNEIDEMINN
jgi:predicted transcriptional regulator